MPELLKFQSRPNGLPLPVQYIDPTQAERIMAAAADKNSAAYAKLGSPITPAAPEYYQTPSLPRPLALTPNNPLADHQNRAPLISKGALPKVNGIARDPYDPGVRDMKSEN